MTAAELRALLRAHPAEALEAVSDMRIAGPWVERSAGCVFRPGAGGRMVVETVPLMISGTAAWFSGGRLIGNYPTLAEAQAAADAHLLAEGWVLVPEVSSDEGSTLTTPASIRFATADQADGAPAFVVLLDEPAERGE